MKDSICIQKSLRVVPWCQIDTIYGLVTNGRQAISSTNVDLVTDRNTYHQEPLSLVTEQVLPLHQHINLRPLYIFIYKVWDEITYPLPNFHGATMTMLFHPILYWTCDYLFMLRLKLILVNTIAIFNDEIPSAA